MKTNIIAGILAAALLMGPAAASAEGLTATVKADASVGVGSGSSTVSGSVRTSAEDRAKDRADQEIERRIKNLTQALDRFGGVKRISDAEKASLTASINAQISALTDLKAKIEADASTTLKADVQSITKSYRIYALILPQTRISAAADRIQTIAGEMSALGAKLEARIASSTGDMSAALSAETDLKAKVADASAQANAAVTASANLQPDNGDKAAQDANKAALKSAQSKLQAATKDLAQARQDIGKILGALTGAGAKAHAEVHASTTNP